MGAEHHKHEKISGRTMGHHRRPCCRAAHCEVLLVWTQKLEKGWLAQDPELRQHSIMMISRRSTTVVAQDRTLQMGANEATPAIRSCPMCSYSDEMAKVPLAKADARDAEVLADYSAQASRLFDNMRVPSALLIGCVMPLGFFASPQQNLRNCLAKGRYRNCEDAQALAPPLGSIGCGLLAHNGHVPDTKRNLPKSPDSIQVAVGDTNK
eukprot:5686121-Amphidinium_carterae.2